MILHIAGINHNDPLGPRKLRQWLRQLSDDHDGPPAFVATEWGKRTFAKIRRQRGRFRRLIKREWPHVSSHFVDTLELSLGYEADSHTDIFPKVEILWLDQGRRRNAAIVERYAEHRVNVYKELLQGQSLPRDSGDALERLKNVAWQKASCPPQGSDRDDGFANLILERVSRGGGDWAIVIVGADHVSANPGYLLSLLEARGTSCEVTVLKRDYEYTRGVDMSQQAVGGKPSYAFYVLLLILIGLLTLGFLEAYLRH